MTVGSLHSAISSPAQPAERQSELKSRPGGKRYILDFAECGIRDVAIVGGKNASLEEIFSELFPKGIKIPPGGAVTVEAFRDFRPAVW